MLSYGNHILSQQESELLQRISQTQFEEICFEELEVKGVSVEFSDATPKDTFRGGMDPLHLASLLKNCEDLLERYYERRKGIKITDDDSLGNGTPENQEWKEITDQIRSLQSLIYRIEAILRGKFTDDEYSILGKYFPSTKTVVIYYKNINDVSRSRNIARKYLIASTYIHEMMHAYFHAFNYNAVQREKISAIEEPMVEFSSLAFLDTLSKKNKDDKELKELLNNTKESIENKQTSYGPIVAYGFGYYLFDNIEAKDRWEWISNYYRKHRDVHEDSAESFLISLMLKFVYPTNNEDFVFNLFKSAIIKQNDDLFNICAKKTDCKVHRCTPIKSTNGISLRIKFDKKEGIIICKNNSWHDCPKIYFDYEFCSDKAEIIIPNYVNKFEHGTFDKQEIKSITLSSRFSEFPTFIDCKALVNIDIPYSIREIVGTPFNGCYSIETLKLPNSITHLGREIFRSCKIKHVILPNSIHKIDGLFTGTDIKKVTLGSNTKEIPNQEFLDCTNLKEIILPNGLEKIGTEAFHGCKGLEIINIPQTVIEIGARAFSSTNITDLKFPDSLKSLSPYIIANCKKLKNVELGKSLTEIPKNTFCECPSLENVKLPDSLEKIGAHAFENCTNLKNLDIPQTVTEIGAYAFCNSAITRLILPDGLACIYPYSFANASKLKNIQLSKSLTEIPPFAFSGCKSLEYIKIHQGIHSIGKHAFEHTNLREINTGGGLKSIGQNAFLKAPLTKFRLTKELTVLEDAFSESGIEVVFVDNNVTSIPQYAFRNATKLSEVIFSPSVEFIEDGAFEKCKNLFIEQFPPKLKSIGVSAFESCDTMLLASLPESVETIGVRAFKKSGLRVINLPNSQIELGTEAFAQTNLRSIRFPSKIKSLPSKLTYKCSMLRELICEGDVKCCDTTFNETLLAQEHNFYKKINKGVYQYHELFENDSDSTELIITDTEIPQNKYKGKNQYKKIIIRDCVTKIGKSAFEGSGIKEIIFEGALKSFEDGIFKDCSELSKIQWPTGIEKIGPSAFEGCCSLEAISLPDSVLELGDRSFAGCSKLASFDMNAHLKIIANEVFLKCKLLNELRLPQSLNKIGRKAFAESGYIHVILPDSITDISNIFECTGVKTISLSNKIKEIPHRAFYRCENLEYLYLPETIEVIGDYSFYNCRALSKINFPVSISKIGKGAFNGSGIKTIVLPENITDISGIFTGNTKVQHITLSTRTSEIPSDAFKGCTNLSKLNIPESIIKIGKDAFKDCKKIKNISLPESVEDISGAFAGSYIESIKLNSKITSIRTGTFNECKQLSSIILPEGFKTIESDAFCGCENLYCIDFPGSLLSISANAFRGCNVSHITYASSQTSVAKNAFDINRIRSIKFSDSFDRITAEAFMNYKQLEYVELGENLISIGEDAFNGCHKLKKINCPRKLQIIEERAFMNCELIDKELFKDVQEVGDFAFYIEPATISGENNTLYILKNSLLGNRLYKSLGTIQHLTLSCAEQLKDLKFNNGRIEKLTIKFTDDFELGKCINCRNGIIVKEIIIEKPRTGLNKLLMDVPFQKLTLPVTLKNLPDEAFNGCIHLNEIRFLSNNCKIGDNTFKNGRLKKIILPKNAEQSFIDRIKQLTGAFCTLEFQE